MSGVDFTCHFVDFGIFGFPFRHLHMSHNCPKTILTWLPQSSSNNCSPITVLSGYLQAVFKADYFHATSQIFTSRHLILQYSFGPKPALLLLLSTCSTNRSRWATDYVSDDGWDPGFYTPCLSSEHDRSICSDGLAPIFPPRNSLDYNLVNNFRHRSVTKWFHCYLITV